MHKEGVDICWHVFNLIVVMGEILQKEMETVAVALRKAAPECGDAITSMTPEMHISDLGLDSIKQLEAAAYLEDAINASFPDDRLAKVVTVEDLLQLVRDQTPSVALASDQS